MVLQEISTRQLCHQRDEPAHSEGASKTADESRCGLGGKTMDFKAGSDSYLLCLEAAGNHFDQRV